LDKECDDGNACNGVEVCDERTGQCRGGSPPDCDDGNVCTEDRCDVNLGCVNTPDTAACPLQLVSAKKLAVKMKASNPKKNKLVFLSKGAFELPRAVDAPTATGATLRIRESSGQDVTFDLPAQSWKARGTKGFIYKDGKRLHGPCTKISFQAGKLLKATCKGEGMELVPPLGNPVQVILRMGNTSYCAAFGGSITKNRADSFVAKAALVPVDCSAAFYSPRSVPEGL